MGSKVFISTMIWHTHITCSSVPKLLHHPGTQVRILAKNRNQILQLLCSSSQLSSTSTSISISSSSSRTTFTTHNLLAGFAVSEGKLSYCQKCGLIFCSIAFEGKVSYCQKCGFLFCSIASRPSLKSVLLQQVACASASRCNARSRLPSYCRNERTVVRTAMGACAAIRAAIAMAASTAAGPFSATCETMPKSLASAPEIVSPVSNKSAAVSAPPAFATK